MAKQQGAIKERSEIAYKTPDMYRVRMHNDDFTTMDFVVMVLCLVFFKSEDNAVELMLTIHCSGSAVVGIYPLDIAQSKAKKAKRLALENGFPLRITIEKD